MFVQSFAILALVALGAQAAPAKRDDAPTSASASASSTSTPPGNPLSTLATLSLPGTPIGVATASPDQILSVVQANSEAVASAVGTGTLLELQASLVMAEAMTAISPTETQLSLFMADVAGTPIVEVSSIGGAAITLATGTASGFPTTFAGHLFTAAPKSNQADTGVHVPRGLVAGALTMLGSIAVGALAVL